VRAGPEHDIETAHLQGGIMVNQNNNKHFNDEALRINRILKKENDSLKETIEKMKAALKALGVNYKEEDDGIKTVSKRHS